ncbi:acetate--CoA ligase family protein [Aquamicrobium defluvii]|uniref:CoA-binding protein n=1 Tax=Aquamicrobium defluvii TaxID=69279 RepID=A0A011V958_9HYPH|nr:acetate--CoA ligase family protein [Aquamicrobium defluvii]EXL04925.1 CoA-binding protein [Aquamicrobium defluvii]EZQ14555.1 CoA-binding protein [Halopseudomonas bauzanensis]
MSQLPERSQIVQRLLSPRSIAIVGASSDLNKVNGRPLKHLLDKGFAGRIFPVNPKYGEIAGLACYPSVADLPQAADLAIVAVPARDVPKSIEELGRKGIRAAVIFSSGFGEMGEAGKARESELAITAREAGVVLLGPNCLGFINAFENVYATFSQYADGAVGAGPIAFVTQSGAFGTAIAALVRQRGLGLGYFINTGNQIDLDFSELMMTVVEDPRIKVAAGYLEGLTDGASLVRLAQRCRELGKPLILTKVGRTSSGVRAAASHTGALAVADTVFDAVLRQYGVLRARNEEQMLDMLEVFCQARSATGNGIGIATQSGGAGVMMADRAEEIGLTVPELQTATKSRLLAIMPSFGSASNPVDVTGQFVAKPELLTESVVALLDDPNVDIGIVWLQLMTDHVDKLVAIFSELQARTTKPFLVCWVAAPKEAVVALRKQGIAVFGAGERAVEAAAALAKYSAWGKDDTLLDEGQPTTPADLVSLPDGAQDTVSATTMLKAIGMPMADVVLVDSEDATVAAWRDLGNPVALKIESPDILHKTEVGGVLLNLNDEGAVRDGFRTLMTRAAHTAPDARIAGVIVQEMSRGHVELVVGVQRDPVFGMIVMVGIGGVFVEVLKDVTFRRAPFAANDAFAMLDELRMASLLDGVRGKPAVDRRQIAEMLVRLSQWAAAMEPVLAELDLNPVLVGEEGCSIVDCVMIFSRKPAKS